MSRHWSSRRAIFLYIEEHFSLVNLFILPYVLVLFFTKKITYFLPLKIKTNRNKLTSHLINNCTTSVK